MSEHELWNELGNLYFLSGSYGKAVHAYNRAIDINPEVGEPCSNLALTYVQMGNYADAAEFYQRGVRLLDNDVDKAVSLHKLGDIYFHLKQFSLAAETYRQTEELVPDFGQIVEASEPFDLLLHCQPSDIGRDRKQDDFIGDVFEDPPLELDEPPMPDELTAWWSDGQVEPETAEEFEFDFGFVDEEGFHYVDGNVVYTEPLVWELERVSPPELTDHNSALTTSSVAKDGVTIISDSTMNNVDSTETIDVAPYQNQIGIDMHMQSVNQVEESVEVDTILTELDHAPVMAVTDKSEVMTEFPELHAQNTTDLATVQYDTPVNWQAIGLSDEERLEIQVDIDRFKKAVEDNPSNSYAWDVLGENYKTLGHYADAINAYQRAISIDSTQALYWYHLGLVYAAVGQNDDAIHAFERVVEVDPDHSLAHATLGGYYRKNGDEEQAKVHLEKARDLMNTDENEYNRACMESICGNTDRSLELLEIALKNKHTYVNLARKDPDLDFIRNDPRFQMLLTEYTINQV